MTERTLLVAGARGVIGQHLVARATGQGFAIRVLTRSEPEARADIAVFHWDPPRCAAGDTEPLEPVVEALEGADLLVNLAGHSLADGRLDDAHKRRVLASRLDTTRALALAHARCQAPPPVWINASATGFYGDRGEEVVDESAGRGAGFLAAVCQRWEEAALEVDPERCRLVLARFGLVLADDAPAWERIVAPIRWGLGGRLGSGQQWWSWIDADDAARALLFLHAAAEARGPVNVTAPRAVRQRDLVREAAIVLHRPSLLPVPAWLLRLATGGVADALLLPSCRARPARLLELGFGWESPDLARELLELLDDEE